MSSPDQEWWIEQSGEYVLGTLSPAEWVTFKKAAKHNDEALALIAYWENAFQPLADALEPIRPANHVWTDIQSRLHGTISENADAIGVQHQPDSDLFDSTDPSDLQLDQFDANVEGQSTLNKSLVKTANRWRGFAGLATAASILFGSWVWVNHIEDRNQATSDDAVAALTPYQSIAIMRDKQALPIWIVDATLDEGSIRVTAIAPPAIDDSTVYALWSVKPNEGGVEWMGLIPSNADQSILLNVEMADKPASFAVSLESADGHSKDAPTGPVLFGGAVKNLSY